MAYKELKKIFPSDIVDYCIVPYLLPDEQEVRQNMRYFRLYHYYLFAGVYGTRVRLNQPRAKQIERHEKFKKLAHTANPNWEYYNFVV